MYNRYIPQSDGTYRRSRIPDCPPRQPAGYPVPQPAASPPPQPEPMPCPPPAPPEPRMIPRQPRPPVRKQSCDNSIMGFLRQLLPKNFDTGDLLVVVLLLLMSGDCAEDQNSALLTLALYLFL